MCDFLGLTEGDLEILSELMEYDTTPRSNSENSTLLQTPLRLKKIPEPRAPPKQKNPRKVLKPRGLSSDGTKITMGEPLQRTREDYHRYLDDINSAYDSSDYFDSLCYSSGDKGDF